MESVRKPPIAVVLAAGQGTRMKSDLPKVLFPVLGRPMIEFVLDALAASGVERVIAVVGYRAEDVKESIGSYLRIRSGTATGQFGNLSCVDYALQAERLGTGHAVKMAVPLLEGQKGPVLIVTGDSPLIQPSSIRALLGHFEQHRPACLLGTLHKSNPAGLGRVVRDTAGQFIGIVEEKDATAEQRQTTEVNMSTYVFDCRELLHALSQLNSDNRQKEFYLTDCPGILKSEGKRVEALPVLKECEALSINTIDELQSVEDAMKKLGYV
jgi:bifunctional UDP-N-acetylglucosamine pyrophosphorylase/glucosamine-1-phosphate N-acetyltransferase